MLAFFFPVRNLKQQIKEKDASLTAVMETAACVEDDDEEISHDSSIGDGGIGP